uniref:PNPLA domain-containing protein n=1 Tax=Ditylenchus dipsaci TaxID=166011 RepID=A0A915EA94_9BILA
MLAQTTYKNKIISSFSKKEELTKALRASCHIPISQFMAAPPPMIDGEVCVDGCWSNNLPVLPNVLTITVSPFSGPVTIGPPKETSAHFERNCQSIYAHLNNFNRAVTAVYPQEKDLKNYFEEGERDALYFLNHNHLNDEHADMQHIKNHTWTDDD